MEKSKIYLGYDRNMFATDEQVVLRFLKEFYTKFREKFNCRKSCYRLMGSVYKSFTINRNSAICIFRCNINNNSTEHDSLFIIITYKFEYIWLKTRETETVEEFDLEFSYHIDSYETGNIFLGVL
jgi:hypothetical protein